MYLQNLIEWISFPNIGSSNHYWSGEIAAFKWQLQEYWLLTRRYSFEIIEKERFILLLFHLLMKKANFTVLFFRISVFWKRDFHSGVNSPVLSSISRSIRMVRARVGYTRKYPMRKLIKQDGLDGGLSGDDVSRFQLGWASIRQTVDRSVLGVLLLSDEEVADLSELLISRLPWLLPVRWAVASADLRVSGRERAKPGHPLV